MANQPAQRVAFILLVAFAAVTVSQASINRGTVQGTVTDPQGAAVPDVQVMVTNVETGVAQALKTNSTGFYFAPELVPGRYKVRFQHSGFVPVDVNEVVVKANDVSTVDTRLALGQTTQHIEVMAAAALVETAASNFSVPLSQHYVQDLPLLGRDIQGLAQLIPGAVQSIGPPGSLVGFNSQFGGLPDSTHSLGSYVSVNGSQAGANVWYLDGNWNAAQGTDNVVVNPSPDAVAEFQAVNNAFAAEYGRNAGGVFNVVLKSGTNSVHGDLYEYNRNSYFHARNPFAQLDAQGNELFDRFVNWNQFGGTVGGPISLPHIYNGKNRTFFFAAWDVSLLHEKVPEVYTVPTVRERHDDFSEIPSISAYGIYDPLTTKPGAGGIYVRQPFLNPDGSLATSIPASRLDPVAQWYVGQYPQPNYLDPLQQNAAAGGCLDLCNNFRGLLGSSQTAHNISAKVDHLISEKNKLFVEWLFNPSYYQNFKLPWTGATAPVQGLGGTNPYRVINQIAALGNTYTFSPTLVNEARVLYSRQAILPSPNPDSLVNNSGVLQQIKGLNIPVAPYVPVPNLAVSGGFNNIGPVPGGWTAGLQMTESFTILDNLTKVLAKHTLKTGFVFRDDRTAYEYNYPTVMTFGGSLTQNWVTGLGGSGLAQFMLGAVDQGSYSGYYHSPYTSNHTWGFYFQDDYRLTRKFTLNLGIRYDLFKWIKEKNNAASFFDFNAPNPVVPSRDGAIVYLGTSGHPGSILFPANKGDFAPRVNFAYSPFGDQKTVIRGGIDLIYTNGMTQLFGQQQGGGQYPAFSQGLFWTTDATGQGLNGFYVTPAFILSKGAPNLPSIQNPKTQDFQGLLNTLYSPEKNQNDPYVAIWNLQIQRQLPGDFMVSVGYVGSKGTHLLGDEYRNFSYVHTADLQKYRLQVNAPVATPPDLVNLEGSTIPLGWTLERFPQYPYGVYDVLNGDGNSSYHGFQLKVEKRYSHGLNFILAYAAQKTIASQDLGGYTANTVYPTASVSGSPGRGRIGLIAGGLGIGGGAQNPDNRHADRGLSPDDIPQVLNFAGTYELPFVRGAWPTAGWARQLIGGWKLSGNLNVQSGVPLQISGPCDNLESIIRSQNYWVGPCRPNLIGNPSAGRGGKSRNQMEQQWFNPNAFEAVYGSDPTLIYALTNGVYPNGTAFNPNNVDALWQFGTAGYRLGNARAPGFWNIDTGLLKDFRISESKYFEFRWEVYNALNHQNLGLPNTGWCLPPNPDGSVDVIHQFGCQFGRITNVQTDPRNMQFALKFFF